MTNEFEEMYNVEDFSENENLQEQKDKTTEERPIDSEELIANGGEGLSYDYTKAPDRAKGPDRENLNGKIMTIEKAEIILPPPEKPWEWSKANTVEYKPCMFVVYYEEGQREYYSGVKVFKRKDSEGNEKYSHPQIHNKGKNQASQLKKVYAKYKKAEPEEISLKQFMSFLNSKPKAKIEFKGFENPETGDDVKKNIVVEFVSQEQ